jgi:hypothetical protein
MIARVLAGVKYLKWYTRLMRIGHHVTSFIRHVIHYRERPRLPDYEGEYFISSEPPYISQFVDTYPSSITPDTLLTDPRHIEAFGARDAKEFTFWAWRDCGIACVKMILDSHHKARGKTMMDLTNEGVDLGGYILYEGGVFVDKGWYHAALAALLEKYRVPAEMKRWQSIESVAKDVLENKQVIVSVTVPGRRSIEEDGSFDLKPGGKTGGHLLLATGVKIHNQIVEGLYAHDPRALPNYQAHTFIPTDKFNEIFSSRTIVSE